MTLTDLIPPDVDLTSYPFVIIESGRFVDAAANLDTVRSILFGDLQTLIDDEPRTVMVPQGEKFDWEAKVITFSIMLNRDCFDTPDDKVVRYSREEVRTTIRKYAPIEKENDHE